ncbi:MAG: kinase-like domain-containing protein [Benjaminiella poitrasii]|nr:MAG: kinase-like domain-containing protein [Benjaminiella poitrasii]
MTYNKKLRKTDDDNVDLTVYCVMTSSKDKRVEAVRATGLIDEFQEDKQDLSLCYANSKSKKSFLKRFLSNIRHKEQNSTSHHLEIVIAQKSKSFASLSAGLASPLKAVNIVFEDNEEKQTVLPISIFAKNSSIISSESTNSLPFLVSPPSPKANSVSVITASEIDDESASIPSFEVCPSLGEYVNKRTSLPPPLLLSLDRPLDNVAFDPLIGQQVGQYRLKELLGTGGFARVYFAENELDNKVVAIKVMDKERTLSDSYFRASVFREYSLLNMIKHERIARLETIVETDEYFCLALEYVQGGDLLDFVNRNLDDNGSYIYERIVKRFICELIDVVSWLHDRNIAHRDIKLENILISFDEENNPHIKLTDFGLACVVDPKNPLLYNRCGSIEYVSPEMYQSENGFDGRACDVWSIGVIMYGLLVGRLPFNYRPAEGDTLTRFMYRVSCATIRWPKDKHVDEETKKVIHSMLERVPENRPALSEIVKLSWFIELKRESNNFTLY